MVYTNIYCDKNDIEKHHQIENLKDELSRTKSRLSNSLDTIENIYFAAVEYGYIDAQMKNKDTIRLVRKQPMAVIDWGSEIFEFEREISLKDFLSQMPAYFLEQTKELVDEIYILREQDSVESGS